MINAATSLYDIRLVSSYDISKRKLIIKEKGKLTFVEFNSIIYCHARSNYTKVVLDSGKSILTSECLKSIVSKISKSNFFRIHASFYINLDKLKSLNKSMRTVHLADTHLPIARSRYDSLLNYLV